MVPTMADHREMCRFSSSASQRYQPIEQAVVDLALFSRTRPHSTIEWTNDLSDERRLQAQGTQSIPPQPDQQPVRREKTSRNSHHTSDEAQQGSSSSADALPMTTTEYPTILAQVSESQWENKPLPLSGSTRSSILKSNVDHIWYSSRTDPRETESDEGYDSLKEQPQLSPKQPESPSNNHSIAISIKGLQKRLSVRGVELDNAEIVVGLPLDTPVSEVGNIVASKGKPDPKRYLEDS